MFQNPKVTQGQAFHLEFSSAVKLELSQRFCFSSLAELPSARGQSILKGFGLGECQIFPALFILWVFSWFLLPWGVDQEGRNSQIVFFTTRNSFSSLHFLVRFLLFLSFFSLLFLVKISLRETCSSKNCGRRSPVDPQQEENSSDLSPENTGTTERGLDISWEQEFLTKSQNSWRKPRGILWELILWFWTHCRGFRVWFWPRICFFLPLSWHCGRAGSWGCSSGAARGCSVGSFWEYLDLWQLQDWNMGWNNPNFQPPIQQRSWLAATTRIFLLKNHSWCWRSFQQVK